MDSVVAGLLHHARLQPDAPAYLGPGKTLTYGGLLRCAQAAAFWLYAGGARAGETVALSLDHTPEDALRSALIIYGLAHLGCVVLPLYPDVAVVKRIELLRRFDARWLVSRHPLEPGASAELIDLRGFDPVAPHGAVPPRGDDPQRPFLFHFTSGTTGEPKACLFSYRQMAQWLLSVSNSIGSTTSDRIVAALRWPELVGMRAMLRMLLTGGGFVNVDVPQSAAQLAALVRDYGVTELMLSPFQVRVLLRNTAASETHIAPLRVLCVGGGFLSPAEVEAVRRAITPNLYLDYGSNETGRLALLGPGDAPGTFGRVGRIVPGIEAQAVDEQRRPVAHGRPGRLRFRAPWFPHDYFGNAKASAERFAEGWFYPGDLGFIDAEGYLVLQGRVDEIINFGGLKIAPAEVEAVLRQHPDIADAALVGVPDPMSGELPVAFLVMRANLEAAALDEFCRERMDASRVPFVFASVAEIPRNPEGKILRDRLRDGFIARQTGRR